jgi:hypothetical protein
MPVSSYTWESEIGPMSCWIPWNTATVSFWESTPTK